MFDLSINCSKSYELKLPDGKVIHVYSPKVKKLKKLLAISKRNNSPEQLDELVELLVDIFSNNKEKKKLSKSIFDDFDFIIVQNLMLDFFSWLSEERVEKN